MLAKRIIPCLDVQNGRVVKGVSFSTLRDAGDPVAAASHYDQSGADELVFLDITASFNGRAPLLRIIEAVASEVFIPLTVGGGIRSLSDARDVLNAGGDKVSLNTAAIQRPALISEISDRYGAQCVVCAVDAKQVAPGRWAIFSHGARQDAGLDAVEWARHVERLGAGEILLTSIDQDGTGEGFDCALIRAVSVAVQIPVIASGGVGSLDHLVHGVVDGGADAVLAASIFHFGQHTIREAKLALRQAGVAVRLEDARA